MRHAVMTGDDRDALWAWLRRRPGATTPSCWNHVLSRSTSATRDGSQAAAEIGRLRAAAAAPA